MSEQNSLNRRKYSRLSLSLPMQIQWVNDKGRMFNESCGSVDVSTGGVYYKSCTGPPLGADGTVTFNLPFSNTGGLGVLKTRCRVVRVEGTDAEGKGIALKFIEGLKFYTPYDD